MLAYGRRPPTGGSQVIIAGAGGAAHLPGHARRGHPAAGDRRPVPLKYLDGMDSLLSIVQMPAGVPVATVSIGNAPQRRHSSPSASWPPPTPTLR